LFNTLMPMCYKNDESQSGIVFEFKSITSEFSAMKFSANRQIPSTTALLSFELVARTLSVTQAASEMCVSPGAVSRQLTELEEFLGIRLFNREKQRLTLNANGQEYSKQVRPLLAQLEEATLNMRTQRAGKRHFRLSVPATFGNRWILPKLGDLYARHPATMLDISTCVGVPDFTEMRLDAALCYCLAPPAGFEATRIYPLRLKAVCARQLFRGGKPPSGLRAFEQYPLMEQTTVADAWPRYFASMGESPPATQRGPRFDLLSMGHEAALAGLGLALLPGYLVDDDLQAGRLVQAHPHEYDTASSYQLVYPGHQAEHPTLNLLRDWLLDISQQQETR